MYLTVGKLVIFGLESSKKLIPNDQSATMIFIDAAPVCQWCATFTLTTFSNPTQLSFGHIYVPETSILDGYIVAESNLYTQIKPLYDM